MFSDASRLGNVFLEGPIRRAVRRVQRRVDRVAGALYVDW